MDSEIYIGIGSNLGHRFEHIRNALRLLEKEVINDMRISVIFETKALLPPRAPSTWDLPYLNLVVSGKTGLTPHSLLKTLKEIERKLGRDLESLRWAPRVIDLDILAFGEEILSEERLTIPHRELMNRPFLVSLMASLSPDWRYPVPGFPYSHLTLGEIMHHHLMFEVGESKCFMPLIQMVGILNITPDSFSDGGKYLHAKKAVERIHELAAHGAAVIDIGGESTRPGAVPISMEEEWRRLEPILDFLLRDFKARPATPKLSLDSYHPEVIERALQHYPIDFINDVNGGKEERLLQIVAQTSCKIVLCHSLTVPASKAVLPFEKAPISYLQDWAEKKIKQLEELGISKDRIILDPGIGFGKSPLQSLSLLSELDLLQKTGCEILVGHSRKSFLKIISNAPDRDLETLGISHFLVRKKVDYLRVHNVEAHQRSLTAAALLEGLS